jgi:hypothetical protein
MMKIFKYILILCYFELFHYIHDVLDATDKSYAFEVTFGAGIVLAVFLPMLFAKNGDCENCNKEKEG